MCLEADDSLALVMCSLASQQGQVTVINSVGFAIVFVVYTSAMRW